MSLIDIRHSWEDAARVAASFVRLIDDVSPNVRVCGSVRRRKSTVGDIEIVACPDNRMALLARLDKLVMDGVAAKSIYENGTHRWGDKYAGLDFQGIRVEVFTATPDNVGYITWLRTGPGDANTFVMTDLSHHSWPVRFEDGAAWHCTYEGGVKRLKSRLRVPDEATLFRLLGMTPLKPEQRTVQAYRRQMRVTPVLMSDITPLIIPDEKPVQKSLL